MADYFTHFSCLLDVGTPENAARALALYNILSEEGASEEPPSEGFLLSIQPEHGGTALWIRDDVTGDPERVIQFVLRCAEQFQLSGKWDSNTPTHARSRASMASAEALTSWIWRHAKPSPGHTPTDGSRRSLMGATTMPEIIETTVYQLAELDEAAKDKARAWFREGGFDHDWYDAVYTDFEQVCAILGITLSARSIRLMGGGSRQEPCIYFRGFWSQGDGACFEGRYAYARGAPAKIREYAPKDTALHQIADALHAVQRRNFYHLHARVRHRGHYYHEYCMDVSVERASPVGHDMTADAENVVVEVLRDLARWLYRQLERDYEYQSSDECIDEAIVANAYTFAKSGRRFG